MENISDKTFERILKVNKTTISVILYTAILIPCARILFYQGKYNVYDFVKFSIPPSIIILGVLLILKKILNSETLEEFNNYFTFIFLSFLFLFYVDLSLSPEIKTILNIKVFYRITSISMPFLSSKLNIENKWLGFIYKSYYLAMFLSLVLLTYKENFHEIQDELSIGIFQIIVSKVSYDANMTYNNEFRKLYVKNEINLGRLTNILNNIKQSLISMI